MREHARQAAVARLHTVSDAQVPESVAREIADAVVDAILPDAPQ